MKYIVIYQNGGAKTKNKIFFKLSEGKYTNISQLEKDLNKKNNDYYVKSIKKNTYLHTSIKNVNKGINLEISKYLINKMNNNLDSTNNNGRTALHLAAKNKNKELYDLLIEKGANENIKDKFGKLPKEFFGKFFKKKSEDIEDIGYNIFESNNNDVSPIEITEFEDLETFEESDTSIEQIKSNLVKFKRNLEKILKN